MGSIKLPNFMQPGFTQPGVYPTAPFTLDKDKPINEGLKGFWVPQVSDFDLVQGIEVSQYGANVTKNPDSWHCGDASALYLDDNDNTSYDPLTGDCTYFVQFMVDEAFSSESTIFHRDGGATNGFAIYTRPNGSYYTVRGGLSLSTVAPSNYVIEMGEVVNAFIVRESGVITLYIRDEVWGTKSAGSSVYNGRGYPLTVGKSYNGAGNADPTVYAVGIWHRALSFEEVVSLGQDVYQGLAPTSEITLPVAQPITEEAPLEGEYLPLPRLIQPGFTNGPFYRPDVPLRLNMQHPVCRDIVVYALPEVDGVRNYVGGTGVDKWDYQDGAGITHTDRGLSARGTNNSGQNAGIGKDNSPVVTTSDGNGTGEFTVLAIGNPQPSSLTKMQGYMQRVQNLGFKQFGLCANMTDTDVNAVTPGTMTFFLYDNVGGAVGAEGLVDGDWHCWVGRRIARIGAQSNIIQLFHDGAFVTGKANATQNVYTSTSSAIGKSADNTNSGATEDLLVTMAWNRALTEEEIAWISANPFALLDPVNETYVDYPNAEQTGESLDLATSSVDVPVHTPTASLVEGLVLTAGITDVSVQTLNANLVEGVVLDASAVNVPVDTQEADIVEGQVLTAGTVDVPLQAVDGTLVEGLVLTASVTNVPIQTPNGVFGDGGLLLNSDDAADVPVQPQPASLVEGLVLVAGVPVDIPVNAIDCIIAEGLVLTPSVPTIPVDHPAALLVSGLTLSGSVVDVPVETPAGLINETDSLEASAISVSVDTPNAILSEGLSLAGTWVGVPVEIPSALVTEGLTLQASVSLVPVALLNASITEGLVLQPTPISVGVSTPMAVLAEGLVFVASASAVPLTPPTGHEIDLTPTSVLNSRKDVDGVYTVMDVSYEVLGYTDGYMNVFFTEDMVHADTKFGDLVTSIDFEEIQ